MSVSLTPKKIGQRVQAARKEQGLTQRDLAEHLQRTPAAISEIERGRVKQIGALDLYELAVLLHKPIEYFYAEDYAGKEVQDLIAIVRSLPPSSRKDLLAIVQGTLRMQELAQLIKASNDTSQLTALAQEFYTTLQPYLEAVGKLYESGRQIQDKLATELDAQRADIAKARKAR